MPNIVTKYEHEVQELCMYCNNQSSGEFDDTIRVFKQLN